MPRPVAALIVGTLLASSAPAQQAPDPGRCDETTKRLDRELKALTERSARDAERRGGLQNAPPTQAFAELLESEALREHLRCLGLGAADRNRSHPGD